MLVYHFTNAQYGIDALSSRQIKISRISDLNDPFELLGTDISDRRLRKAFLAMKKDLSNKYGLLCFSQDWRNPLMWSHYAEKHRGICLGFEVPSSLLCRVNYTTKRSSSKSLYDDSYSEDDFLKLICTKFSQWRYEKEVRCFVTLERKNAINGHYFSNFSEELKLKRAIVGCASILSRSDIDNALGDDVDHIERFKARPAFKQFRVVQNRNSSLWS